MVMHCYLPPQLPMIFQFQRKNGRFSTFNRLINVRTESGLNNKITHFFNVISMLISSVECSQNMKVDTNAVVTKEENT